jgi:hypothetical protein
MIGGQIAMTVGNSELFQWPNAALSLINAALTGNMGTSHGLSGRYVPDVIAGRDCNQKQSRGSTRAEAQTQQNALEQTEF